MPGCAGTNPPPAASPPGALAVLPLTMLLVTVRLPALATPAPLIIPLPVFIAAFELTIVLVTEESPKYGQRPEVIDAMEMSWDEKPPPRREVSIRKSRDRAL